MARSTMFSDSIITINGVACEPIVSVDIDIPMQVLLPARPDLAAAYLGKLNLTLIDPSPARLVKMIAKLHRRQTSFNYVKARRKARNRARKGQHGS